MKNIDRYNKVFQETFNVSLDLLNDDFNSDSVAEWDSVVQLSLVTALEDEFDIMFDSGDILDFKAYVSGMKILAKYGIEL